MTSILFTTGSTVTFKKLIEAITEYEFIAESVIGNGVTKMVIQYGNEIESGTSKHISEDFFKRCLADNKLVQLLQFQVELEEDNVVTYTSSRFHGFQLIAFPFSNAISEVISNCDLVISHAGTGSIIDSLRLERSLIVVTNDNLMDNHQEEVASELAKLGCCCKISIADIYAHKLKLLISNILSGIESFTRFPECEKNPVEGIIFEELVR